MNQHISHKVAIVSIGMLVAAFFYQTLLYGKLPVPTDTLVGLYHPWRDMYASIYPRGIPFKNFLITDPIRQQIPWRKIAIDSWKNGRVPHWNPYSFAGVPLDANIQAAAFYPFNILFLVFQFPVAWSMLVIVQPLGAALMLFVYLRHLKLSSVSSLVGAVSWSFCGFSVAWMSWGTMMQTAMWIPLILLSIDQIVSTRRMNQAILWGMIATGGVVMVVLAGHAQIALYAMGIVVIYAVWRIRDKADWMTRRRIIRIMALVLISGLVVSGVGWVPLVQFFSESARMHVAESAGQPGWFLPWQHLVQFIAPDFFGNPSTLNYWGVWNYGELIGYIGILPLIFAVSALYTGGITTFWSSLALGSIVLMLDHPGTRVMQWLHVPVWSVLQPTRLMMVVDLSLSVLAAVGFERFLYGKSVRNVRNASVVIGVSFLVLWVGVLAYSRWGADSVLVEYLLVSQRNLILPLILYIVSVFFIATNYKLRRYKVFWVSAIIVLTMFDVVRFGWKFTPFTDLKYFFPVTRIITFLQKQPKPFRIASLDDRIMPPNVSGYFGLETIEGYDPLAPFRFDQYARMSESGSTERTGGGFNRIYTLHNTDSSLFPYFNVVYVLSLEEILSPDMTLVFTEGETKLYKYTRALPRVYLAQNIMTSASVKDSDILQSVRTIVPSGSTVVVERALNVQSVPLSAEESAHIISYDPYHITMSTQTSYSRVIVILNRYDPGAEVTVDGLPASLERVNYLFSGVVVPSGQHRVMVKYE